MSRHLESEQRPGAWQAPPSLGREVAAHTMRIHRAIVTIEVAGKSQGGGSGRVSHLRGPSPAAFEPLLPDSLRRIKFQPALEDIDAALPLLATLVGVDRLTREVITLRAFQEIGGKRGGWRRIGIRLGLSGGAARKAHDAAMLGSYRRYVGTE